ncbi:hypothetical protein Avbf_17930 [Armadillidium vulgare]|nr:hypothetical protein Avbf_17930 [Armadillidium vulgare]
MDTKSSEYEIKDEKLEITDDGTGGHYLEQISELKETNYLNVDVKNEVEVKDGPVDIEEKVAGNDKLFELISESDENREEVKYRNVDVKNEIEVKEGLSDIEEEDTGNNKHFEQLSESDESLYNTIQSSSLISSYSQHSVHICTVLYHN